MRDPKGELEGYLDVEERESREIQRANLRAIAREMLAQPGPFFWGCAALVISTAAILVEPRLFGYVIDDAIVPHRWDLIQELSLVYLVIVIARVVSTIGSAYLFELLGQRVTQELRCRLFSHLQRLPISVYDKNPAGRLLTRVTNDIASLGEMFTAGFVSMIGNALMVLGIQIWLIALDAKLGLIAGSVLPVLLGLSYYFSGKLRVAYREARSKLSALNAFLAENILGMKVVHLFNRERLQLERFDRINQWYADARIGSIRIFAYFQPTITICSAIAVALVIYFGGRETLSGNIKVGVLFAYFSYILSMFQPLREIADKWNIFLSGMASAERIFGIVGTGGGAEGNPGWQTELRAEEVDGAAKPLSTVHGHIVFENVWFAYVKEHWVLRDFSLEIKPGQSIGIVGHTGAGKTTLISLLMRFYEPQKGRILLDGKDLREYSRRELRSAIGIIQQDVFLFSGSLEENMTFWSPEGLGHEAAKHYLERFGAKQENLLERGGNLSMGERQVLAFVRALTARPKIWILDEATANMDSGSEAELQEELKSATEGRTSLLIAHRLATVRTADRIIVLHKGALVEQGSHGELIAREGLYAKLYRYQQALDAADTGVEESSARTAEEAMDRQPEPVN